MSVCTRTSIQSYKVWSNMDTPASMSALKFVTCWMGSKLTNWTLQRGKYGPPPHYRPTLTTVSRSSRILLTIRRLPRQGPPPLHRSGPRGNPTILRAMAPSLTCLWMTATTRAKNTPSCPGPRSSASSSNAKDEVTSRITWETTSLVTQATEADLGQDRNSHVMRKQQRTLSRHSPGSSLKVNIRMTTQQPISSPKPIPMQGPTIQRTGPTRRCNDENDHDAPGDKATWFGPSRSSDPSAPLALLEPKPVFWTKEPNWIATRIHPWLAVAPPYSYTTTKPPCGCRGIMGTSGKGLIAESSVQLWHICL